MESSSWNLFFRFMVSETIQLLSVLMIPFYKQKKSLSPFRQIPQKLETIINEKISMLKKAKFDMPKTFVCCIAFHKLYFNSFSSLIIQKVILSVISACKQSIEILCLSVSLENVTDGVYDHDISG